MIQLDEIASDVEESKGNDEKDSEYLARIQKATPKSTGHPRHLGISMQAHHAISAKGMKLSNKGKKYKDFDYDINMLPNLVFIPCTLKGACYLGVQPHRGNHGKYTPSKKNDDEHPGSYHMYVAELVKNMDRKFNKECTTQGVNLNELAQKLLDGVSAIIIDDIQNEPEAAQLTRIWHHFAPGSKTGCGGVDNVGQHKGTACPANRKHKKKANDETTNAEEKGITYKSNGRYQLEPGK